MTTETTKTAAQSFIDFAADGGETLTRAYPGTRRGPQRAWFGRGTHADQHDAHVETYRELYDALHAAMGSFGDWSEDAL